MKTLKVAAICALLAISGQGFAKPAKSQVTPIVFAKGSSCGYYDGNIAGKKFTLFLKENQTLILDVDSSKPIYPTVKNPKGQILKDKGYDEYEYETQFKGAHTIRFDIDDKSYPFAEIKFCAY